MAALPPPPSYAQAVASRVDPAPIVDPVWCPSDQHQQRIDGACQGGSTHVWRVPELRIRQREVLTKYIDPRTPKYMIACLRTSAGKSHCMRLIGTMERGVMLIFIPLLTLSADILDKFISTDQRYGKVGVVHLDEMVDNAPEEYESFLQTCILLPKDTANTIFAFLSPHHLVNHPRSLAAILRAAENGSLRSVVMDEVHLHVQHGTSFRHECRLLRTQFFRLVFHPTGRTSQCAISSNISHHSNTLRSRDRESHHSPIP